jgi:hypothetical protein
VRDSFAEISFKYVCSTHCKGDTADTGSQRLPASDVQGDCDTHIGKGRFLKKNISNSKQMQRVLSNLLKPGNFTPWLDSLKRNIERILRMEDKCIKAKRKFLFELHIKD